MKKVLMIILIIVLMAAILLTGCGQTSNQRAKLIVLNWGDYIDPDLITRFEEENSWIDLTYNTVPSNEEMYTIVDTQGSDIDLIFPSDYIIERLIKEDKLHKINYDNVPNFEYIIDFCKNREFDPKNEYSVPYAWGTLGILYNKEMVDTPVDSWSILWDEKYSKQIYMYDSMRDSLAVALKKLHFDVNTRNTDEIEQAAAELISQKPLVLAYGGDDIKDSMILESAALGVTYSGDAAYAIMENENLAYSVPKEGSNIWFDNMAILKTSDAPAAAEAFINFLLDPEIATINTEYIAYSSPNSEVLANLDEEYTGNMAFNPTQEEIDRCEVFLDLDDFVDVYNEAWLKVKLD